MKKEVLLMMKLDQLIQTHCLNGVKYKSIQETVGLNRGRRLTKSQLSENGKYEVYHGSKDTILGKYDKSNAPANTVIVVNTGGVGGVKYLSEPFWCSDGSFWLGQHDDINSKYLYYCLVRYEDYFASQKREGGVPTIDRSVVENFKIPVPPLPVQEEIVRILDKFTELEAELAQELAQELALQKKRYTFVRDQLLDFDCKIPIVKLKDIATDMYRGSGIKRDQVTEDGIPCVRYGEIYTTYNTWFDTCVSHTLEKYVSNPKYFEHGDILFAITGESVEEIAKSIVYVGNEKCLAGGDIVVMKHNQNPKYLSYALSTYNATQQKSKGKIKSKVVHSSVPAIGEIEIPLPSLDVQERLVQVLDNFDAICSDLSIGLPAEIAAREKQYNYYRDLLFNYAANGLDLSRAEQSRAEQSRAEQS